MNVLLIFDNYESSGTHRVALNLMNAAPCVSGLNFWGLICMTDKLGITQEDARFSWPTSCFGRGEALTVKALKLLFLLFIMPIVASKYDVLVATCPPSALVGFWASLWTRKPLISWIHYDFEGRKLESVGSTGGLLRDLVQNMLHYRFMPCLTRLIFVSHASRASMIKGSRRSDIPAQWFVIPNILPAFDPLPLPSLTPQLEKMLSSEEPLVVFIGRLARQKRWEHALLAAECLHKMGGRANWLFIGDGPEGRSFREACDRSFLRNRILSIGFESNPLPLLAKADALVLTSLYEAWPTVILEAFQLSVPVVAYNCPSGPSDLLGQNERGWLTVESPVFLASALCEVFDPFNRDVVLSRCKAAVEFLHFHGAQQVMPLWLRAFRAALSAYK